MAKFVTVVIVVQLLACVDPDNARLFALCFLSKCKHFKKKYRYLLARLTSSYLAILTHLLYFLEENINHDNNNLTCSAVCKPDGYKVPHNLDKTFSK